MSIRARMDRLRLRMPVIGNSKVADLKKRLGTTHQSSVSLMSELEIYQIVSALPPSRWDDIPCRFDGKICQIIWKSFGKEQPLAQNHEFLLWFASRRIGDSTDLACRLVLGLTWSWPDNAAELMDELAPRIATVVWPTAEWRENVVRRAWAGANIPELVAREWGGEVSFKRGLVRLLWSEFLITVSNYIKSGQTRVTDGLRSFVELTFSDDSQFRWFRSEVEYLEVEYLNAVLPPLRNKVSSPASVYLKGSTLKAFGRPGTGLWLKATPEAQKVGLLWLSTLRVEKFFDFVEKHHSRQGGDHDGLRHVKERRRFWQSAFDAGIDEVQLFLGENLRSRLSEQDRSSIYPAWLTTKGSHYTGDHAALIIKIGNMTIVEWSHKAATHVWLKADMKAPSCSKQMYRADEMIKNSAIKLHHRGEWQERYVDLIYQESRVRLDNVR